MVDLSIPVHHDYKSLLNGKYCYQLSEVFDPSPWSFKGAVQVYIDLPQAETNAESAYLSCEMGR